MEITKGENANLAGMEPRCPKCGSEVTWWITSKDCMPVVRCRAEKCDEIFRIKELSDFAQFFRSPAPTPPLDVARDAARYWRLRLLGCAPVETKQLENGTVLRFSNLDEFVDHDIKIHSSRGEAELYERRHLASPAPQLKLKIQELVGLPVDREIEDDLVFSAVKALHHAVGLCQHSHWGASPAQPEKRDEWVSVDERLPEADSQVPELSERVDFFAPGMIAERKFQRGRIKYGHCWRSATGDGEFDLTEVTHWQPIPAPPQSGKEGQ